MHSPQRRGPKTRTRSVPETMSAEDPAVGGRLPPPPGGQTGRILGGRKGGICGRPGRVDAPKRDGGGCSRNETASPPAGSPGSSAQPAAHPQCRHSAAWASCRSSGRSAVPDGRTSAAAVPTGAAVDMISQWSGWAAGVDGGNAAMPESTTANPTSMLAMPRNAGIALAAMPSATLLVLTGSDSMKVTESGGPNPLRAGHGT